MPEPRAPRGLFYRRTGPHVNTRTTRQRKAMRARSELSDVYYVEIVCFFERARETPRVPSFWIEVTVLFQPLKLCGAEGRRSGVPEVIGATTENTSNVCGSRLSVNHVLLTEGSAVRSMRRRKGCFLIRYPAMIHRMLRMERAIQTFASAA